MMYMLTQTANTNALWAQDKQPSAVELRLEHLLKLPPLLTLLRSSKLAVAANRNKLPMPSYR